MKICLYSIPVEGIDTELNQGIVISKR